MKLKKKILSGLCLLTAASMVVSCSKPPVQKTSPAVKNISEKKISKEQEKETETDMFSVLTLSKDGGGIYADGSFAGQSACGFTLKDDGSITVNVDGSELPFEEAAEKTGCTLTENADGGIMIQSPFQKSQVIVKSDKEFDTYGAEKVEETVRDHFLLTYSSPSEAYSAYKLLSEDENIEYAEANAVYRSAGFEETKRIETWGLDRIGAVDFCRELSEKNSNLPEVDVAVIDTGIFYEHDLFEGRILDGGRNFCEEYKSEERNMAEDDEGHGTHCAGIICSSTNDNVKILPVKSLDSHGAGSAYEIYCGMMYAIDCDADIISMSLGGYGKSNLFSEAVAKAHDKGIILCVAAGNESLSCDDSYSSLSGIEECVVVSSVNQMLEPSDFSNYQNIDFAAPGDDILSAALGETDAEIEMSGTSMATPYAAACFANVLSADNTLSAEKAYDIIKANAVDLCEPGYDDRTGWGMVNLYDFRMSTERTDAPSAAPSHHGENYESEKIVIKSGVLKECNYEEDVINLAEMVDQKIIPEFTAVGEYVFMESSVKEVILPDSVKKISHNAFSMCYNLERVVTKAEEIDDYAFSLCAGLEEISDSNIRQIGYEVFTGCSSLEKADFTALTEIPKSSFESCRNLKSKSFSFEKIKNIGPYAFKGSGISGTVNLSSVEHVDDFAFSQTAIEEIYLTDKITSLSDSVFKGCSRLKKISAPSVTEIYDNALALGKTGFTEDNAVETDIDFSRVKYIGDMYTFNGYVFSEPVSFDQLESVCWTAFDGAYGESLSFPAARKTYDTGKQADIRVNSMIFESVEELDLSMLYFYGALGVGSSIESISTFLNEPENFWVYSLTDDPDTAEILNKQGFELNSRSDFLITCDDASIPVFNAYKMCFVLPGKHLTYSYTITDEAGNSVFEKQNSDMPVNYTFTKAGSYICSIEIKEPSGSIVYNEDVNIEVYECGDVYDLEINKAEVLTNTEYDDDRYSAVFCFTPDTDGDYKICCSERNISVISQDGRVINGFINTDTFWYDGVNEMNFKGGETYFIAVSAETTDKLYISVNNADSSLRSVSEIRNNGRIDFLKESDGSETVQLYYGTGELLTEGKDYEIEYFKNAHNKDVHDILIYGIGKYYGMMYYDSVSFIPLAKLNETTAALSKEVDFIPEKSGMYNIVFSPARDYIDEIIEKELCIYDFGFNPEVEIIGDKNNEKYSDYNPDRELEFTGPSEFTVWLEEGVRYRIINNFGCFTDVLITDKPTLGMCDADYSVSFQYNGEAVIPDIKLSYEDKPLEEGKDYTLTVWKNNAPGLMFVMAEGCGDFAGLRNFAMVIEGEGCPLKVSSYRGMDIIDVNTDEDFEYLSFLPYRITVDRDTSVCVKGVTEKTCYSTDFFSANHEINEDVYYNGEENLILKKGTYFVQIYPDEGIGIFESLYRKTIRINTDDTIKSISDAETVIVFDSEGNPQISLTYDGELLEEGIDYSAKKNEYDGELPEIGIGCSAEENEYEDEDEESYSKGDYVVFTGKGRFAGKKEVKYIVLPKTDEQCMFIPDEYYFVESDLPVRMEWNPEAERYIFESTSYINSDVIITDEDNVLVWNGTVSSKNTPDITVEPGRKYYVYITVDFNDEIKVAARTQGRLSDCVTEYDALVPFTDSKEVPDIIFRDGDYVLEEGKDYTFSIDGFVNDAGRREYVFTGCGNYFGDAVVSVVTYHETINDFDKYTEAELFEEYSFSFDDFIGYTVGEKIKLKLTSEYDEKMRYHIALGNLSEESREYINVFMYDSEGKFIGANDDVRNFELDKDQTVYIMLLPPYVNEYEEQDEAYDCLLSITAEKCEQSENTEKFYAGDVNCDGKINIFDFMRLRRFIIGTGELSEQGRINAMLAGSENREAPDSRDLLMLKKIILIDED